MVKVAEAIQLALNEDLTGLLLPVLAALFDLPLPAKHRREALQLARDALGVVADQDVPLVVRHYVGEDDGVGRCVARGLSSQSLRPLLIHDLPDPRIYMLHARLRPLIL